MRMIKLWMFAAILSFSGVWGAKALVMTHAYSNGHYGHP